MGLKRFFNKKIGARKWFVAVAALSLAGVVSAAAVAIPNLFPFLDPTGFVSTYNTTGPIQQNGAFFQSLGTNGRSCSTCHIAASQGLPANFILPGGLDGDILGERLICGLVRRIIGVRSHARVGQHPGTREGG